MNTISMIGLGLKIGGCLLAVYMYVFVVSEKYYLDFML